VLALDRQLDEKEVKIGKMALIWLDNLHVDFPIFDNSNRQLISRETMRGALGGILHKDDRRHVEVAALSGIDMVIRSGDRVGLMGHNGAGKTTLLQVIGTLLEPSKGSVYVDGNVSCLLDLSMGMNLDDTGYQNIKMMGLLFGWARSEMDAAIADIEEFSELGSYLDLPVRIYSAGMKARLVFGIVTAKPPQILLLDEAIGAGDAAFQSKVKARLDSFMGNVEILILASHSADTIKALCNHAILLERGHKVFEGDPGEVHDFYLKGDHPFPPERHIISEEERAEIYWQENADVAINPIFGIDGQLGIEGPRQHFLRHGGVEGRNWPT
jgi:ABC-type polysaccharide/polyol phosphate transport system ATPase subunit